MRWIALALCALSLAGCAADRPVCFVKDGGGQLRLAPPGCGDVRPFE
jgi:hypothetical protein